jgi:hypothetical protein
MESEIPSIAGAKRMAIVVDRRTRGCGNVIWWVGVRYGEIDNRQSVLTF